MKKRTYKTRSCGEFIPTNQIEKPIVGKYEFDPVISKWLFKIKSK